METLEKLLNQPLKVIIDNGFSLRVLAKINRYQTLRVRFLTSLYIVLTFCLISIFPIFDLVKKLFASLISFCQAIGQVLTPKVTMLIPKNIELSPFIQEPLICFSLVLGIGFVFTLFLSEQQ